MWSEWARQFEDLRGAEPTLNEIVACGVREARRYEERAARREQHESVYGY